MVNVFSGLQQQTPPPQDGQDDEMKNAIEQLIAQQQAGEPSPRPPTPEEGEQIKQLGMQMMQARGAKPATPKDDQGPPLPSGVDNMGKTAQQPTGPSSNPFAGMAAGGGFGGPTPEMLAQSGNPGAPGAAKPDTSPAPAPNPYAGMSAGMGFGGPNLDLMRNPTGAPAVPHDVVGKKTFDTFNNALATVSGNTEPPSPSAEKILLHAKPGESEEGPPEGWPNKKSGGTPAGSEEDEGEQIRPKGEIGTPEHEAHLAKEVAPQAREVADALTKSGVDSPDKADIAIRSKYHDDPDLEKAIAEARTTYDQLRELNNTPPTVTQYIGAILLGLVGASPHVISNILHPAQALNAQREGMAGESLMKLQLAKAANRGKQMDIQAKQGDDSMAQKRLDQQMSIFQQREGDQNKHERSKEMRVSLEKARENAASMARHYADLASKSVGNEKKKNLDLADQYRQQSEGFGGMLGEPSLNQMKQMQQKPQPQPGKPTSMAPQGQVSPSAMRLLGIGNA